MGKSVLDEPGTLSITITALAPACWALRALSTNVHSPRSTIIILSFTSFKF